MFVVLQGNHSIELFGVFVGRKNRTLIVVIKITNI